MANRTGSPGTYSARSMTCRAVSKVGKRTDSEVSSTSASSSCRPSRVPWYMAVISETNSGARCRALAKVASFDSRVVGSPRIRPRSLIGLGVVVTTVRGCCPSRRQSRTVSHIRCGCCQAQSSSHQSRSNWSPRARSGWSADRQIAMAPLGQVSRRFDGSNRGRFQGGAMVRMPLGPWIMVSR